MLRQRCTLLVTMLAIGVGSATGQTVETRAGEQAVVLQVAHIEKGNKYCFGELLVSRNRISFTVEDPPAKANHGFEVLIGSVQAALPGEQVGLRYLELRFDGGLSPQFFHSASRGSGGYQLDTGSTGIFVAAAAVTDFDTTVETLKAGPIKTPTGPPPPPEIDQTRDTIKYLVAHADEKNTYCYGWLNVSRDSLSYEVLWPTEKASHGWNLKRDEISSTKAVDRNDWRWIEIKPRSGKVQAFASAQEAGFGYYVVRPHQYAIFDALRPVKDFDSEWRRLQGTLTEVDEGCQGTVWIRSDPSEAEIYVDGEFVGSTPAKLTLMAGKRKIQVKTEGFPEWVREVKITCGAIINLPVKWE